MILDTSAIIAILFREPTATSLLECMRQSSVRGVGTPTLVEAGVVLTARAGEPAVAWLHRFVQEFEVSVIPFEAAHWQEAVAAYNQFGRGRHPAALNLGDCFSYATARLAGQALLCVGDDFPKTDLAIVRLA
jgi:ribonuclease VapC